MAPDRYDEVEKSRIEWLRKSGHLSDNGYVLYLNGDCVVFRHKTEFKKYEKDPGFVELCEFLGGKKDSIDERNIFALRLGSFNGG